MQDFWRKIWIQNGPTISVYDELRTSPSVSDKFEKCSRGHSNEKFILHHPMGLIAKDTKQKSRKSCVMLSRDGDKRRIAKIAFHDFLLKTLVLIVFLEVLWIFRRDVHTRFSSPTSWKIQILVDISRKTRFRIRVPHKAKRVSWLFFGLHVVCIFSQQFLKSCRERCPTPLDLSTGTTG